MSAAVLDFYTGQQQALEEASLYERVSVKIMDLGPISIEVSLPRKTLRRMIAAEDSDFTSILRAGFSRASWSTFHNAGKGPFELLRAVVSLMLRSNADVIGWEREQLE